MVIKKSILYFLGFFKQSLRNLFEYKVKIFFAISILILLSVCNALFTNFLEKTINFSVLIKNISYILL